MLRRVAIIGGLVGMTIWTSAPLNADEPKTPARSETSKPNSASAAAPAGGETKYESSSSSSGGSGSSEESKPKHPAFSAVTKEHKLIPGLIPLYTKEGVVLAELGPNVLNRDFILVISIARGIGHGHLLGGMSWGGNGDDAIVQFRKVDDQIQVVRRNVRFTAAKGSPEEKAVGFAYTDSILFSLPIATVSPSGAYVVNLDSVFMTDLPQIAHDLPGYSFSPNRSTWAEVRGYPDNIELEVAATYGSGGMTEIDSVPDSRAVSVTIHYSLSFLPQNGYRPRLADDRIGYFITAMKDYSQKVDEDRFVRYISRWDLQKADPGADVSPPKKPIIFWLEKTVPYKYRKPIREGILEWNKAFEKAGFVNAIEVRQQPDNSDWDPEDVNYNTFRWITSSAKFAMGPSRVNPLNGQILNASVIFDADFLQFWKTEYETFTPSGIAALTGGPLDLKSYQEQQSHGNHLFDHCALADGEAMQFAFGSAMAMLEPRAGVGRRAGTSRRTQGLKMVTMHEVGHTLGLRHNFKGSAMLSLEDLNNPDKTRDNGMGSSVMDYYPVNIVPKGVKQGFYYTPTIGPYDMWALEYGYKSIAAGDTEGELPELKKVASRSGEPNLAYSTDEDTRGIDSDPLSNRFDLGNDTVAYARQRAKVVSDAWPKLIDQVTKDGDGYQRARQAFGVLLGSEGTAMFFAGRYVGGVYVNRSHKGDSKALGSLRRASTPRSSARAAGAARTASLQRYAVSISARGSTSTLAASHWDHWGSEIPIRDDYPVHEVIAMWQDRILSELFSSLTLQRLYDSELKIPADQDAFTTAELIHGLTTAIFAEVDKLPAGEFSNRKPAISSVRRNLQRLYLKRIAELAMGNSDAPQDCQTVAYVELKQLNERINKLLGDKVKLDDYTRDHLTETSNRIAKVLEAHLQLRAP